jgi:predicted transport protein
MAPAFHWVSYATSERGLPVASIVFRNRPLRVTIVLPGDTQIAGANARDVTQIGHHGFGDLSIEVNSVDDIPSVVQAVSMSIEMIEAE